MRTLPRTEDDWPPILVIRTDFRDEEGWRAVRAALDVPWVLDEDDSVKEEILFVEDPAWADAGPAEILDALTAPGEGEGGEPAECGWRVVFLADRAGMDHEKPSLLAVSTDPDEETPSFRVLARVTPHGMHCNLTLANMDFFEFEGWDAEELAESS
ncbi:DUF6924 domain-containing protein [Streptomyces griseoaurantiacus]|uniref:DUF6924 domain-containing protein n=1 Tax=Streptomyces griseoaurantiacus TaxID=68213 RepID=UPI00345FC33E